MNILKNGYEKKNGPESEGQWSEGKASRPECSRLRGRRRRNFQELGLTKSGKMMALQRRGERVPEGSHADDD